MERITEFEFLASSPSFFQWSGARTELFISSILIAAIIAGYAVRIPLPVVLSSFTAGIAILVCLFFYLCGQKVCYSGGIDGLESLRMGYFFACLGVVGIFAGARLKTGESYTGKTEAFALGIATIGAIAYYPVIFTLAGVRLLPPLEPFPTLLVVALPSFVIAARGVRSNGQRLGAATPIIGTVLLLAIASGIAVQYFSEVTLEIILVIGSSCVAAAIGSLVAARERSRGLGSKHLTDSPPRRLAKSNKPLYAAVALVLLMMVVFLPDAANGVIPFEVTGQSTSSYQFGAVPYVGGFMTQSFVRTTGVALDVSFAGTNASTIQDDNYLSAGIGVHSPHCCVDGIDFGYRFDAYLFHDGAEDLVASAWEVCDTVMACGGHSWQHLLFFSEEPLNASGSSSPASQLTLHLDLQWKGRTVYWSYSYNQGASAYNFTSFTPPSYENAYFNAGTGGTIPSNPEPPTQLHYDVPANYIPELKPVPLFFQYGLMSRYPIGHGGWSVSFSCPSYMNENGSWTCISHSDSVQGDQAYWKALWRWGEPYLNVRAVASETGLIPSVSFSYSQSSTLESFQTFW